MSKKTTEPIVTQTPTDSIEAIDMIEVKKAAKRAIKFIMNESLNNSIIVELVNFAFKTEKRDETIDLKEKCPSFIEVDLSQQECEELRMRLIKKINKRLNKKQTFLATARLLEAIKAITEPEEYNFPEDDKVKVCNELLSRISFNEDVFRILFMVDELSADN